MADLNLIATCGFGHSVSGVRAQDPVLYAGSRAGMLNGFRSAPGKERLSVATARRLGSVQSSRTSDFPYDVAVGRIYDGPFDLLLELVRKQELDIYDIPISRITAQFLLHVERLKEAEVEAAGEFVYVAAMLVQIKSRMLLPAQSEKESAATDALSEDPRQELVDRLLEHERFKLAARELRERERSEGARLSRGTKADGLAPPEQRGQYAADGPDLVRRFQGVLDRMQARTVLQVEQDAAPAAEYIEILEQRFAADAGPLTLQSLLASSSSELTVVGIFLALLELVRLQIIVVRQDTNFGEVYVKASATLKQDASRSEVA